MDIQFLQLPQLRKARAAGTAAPETDEFTGKMINPHNPEFITKAAAITDGTKQRRQTNTEFRLHKRVLGQGTWMMSIVLGTYALSLYFDQEGESFGR